MNQSSNPALAISPDTLTRWSFGFGSTALGTYCESNDNRGLVLRAVPDNLINLVNTGRLLADDALMMAVPYDSPTMLLQVADTDAVGDLIDSLTRLRFEMMGLDDATVEQLANVISDLADEIASGLMPETSDVDNAATDYAASGTIDTSAYLNTAANSSSSHSEQQARYDQFAETVLAAPMLDFPITVSQVQALNDVARGLLEFDPPKFDQSNISYAYITVFGDVVLASPEEVFLNAGDPSLFVGFDVVGFAALGIQPLRGEMWHEYTTRVFGINDHLNGAAWSFLFGSLIADTDGNTPRDAGRRITAFVVKALESGMVVTS